MEKSDSPISDLSRRRQVLWQRQASWPREASRPSRASERDRTPSVSADGGSSHDVLPLALLERLLASKIVPRDAKLAAIERWRHELAEARSLDPFRRKLDERLAEASRSLRRAPWISAVRRSAPAVREGVSAMFAARRVRGSMT